MKRKRVAEIPQRRRLAPSLASDIGVETLVDKSLAFTPNAGGEGPLAVHGSPSAASTMRRKLPVALSCADMSG